ncbi:MAG: hypothetical protein WCR58_06200 [Bacteroidales bacterium]|jgi:hypothetical protein|nr:hypothetical protein [Bacteroidales bacterium]MDD3701483.1 hypothetical protein [Bacteroidales bacterium]MDY0369210.1 hypothetical protein [Bacteroidales bacterium]
MSALSHIIKPLEGCGDLHFGQSIEDITALLGEAEEIDHLDTDDDMTTVVLHFWEQYISIFFEGVERTVLACFETDHPDTLLFGKKVFELSREETIALMQSNGYHELETEEEEGEIRISFEDGLIDFFYDGDTLLAVNWGVYVDEAGNIIQY